MAEKPASLENEWSFGPDVPTYDFFKDRDVRNECDREWLVDDLNYALKKGDFLRWEAVVTRDLGLPLTARQRRAIGELLNFTDEPDEGPILYIDGLPRPDRLWYEIVRVIAAHLLVVPFKTFECHYAVTTDGWPELVAAINEHGKGLSLPEGAERPIEVVNADLRHKLWLQACFMILSGLGQEPALTLHDPGQHYRVTSFIESLKTHKDEVVPLGLTLESLRTLLILPPRDEPIFAEMMTAQLGLASMNDPIAGHLG